MNTTIDRYLARVPLTKVHTLIFPITVRQQPSHERTHQRTQPPGSSRNKHTPSCFSRALGLYVLGLLLFPCLWHTERARRIAPVSRLSCFSRPHGTERTLEPLDPTRSNDQEPHWVDHAFCGSLQDSLMIRKATSPSPHPFAQNNYKTQRYAVPRVLRGPLRTHIVVGRVT